MAYNQPILLLICPIREIWILFKPRESFQNCTDQQHTEVKPQVFYLWTHKFQMHILKLHSNGAVIWSNGILMPQLWIKLLCQFRTSPTTQSRYFFLFLVCGRISSLYSASVLIKPLSLTLHTHFLLFLHSCISSNSLKQLSQTEKNFTLKRKQRKPTQETQTQFSNNW